MRTDQLLAVAAALFSSGALTHAQQTPLLDAASKTKQTTILLDATERAISDPRITIEAGTLRRYTDGARDDETLWMWPIRASVTVTRGDMKLSAGLVGQRGSSVPSYVVVPVSATSTGSRPVPAFHDFSSRTTWTFEARVEQSLWKTPGGKTISVLGDITVPLAATSGGASSYNSEAIHAKAARIGVRFGF